MTTSRVSYEVQIYSTDHWVLDRSFRTEADARAHGKRLFANPRCEGYRVMRDWQKPIGYHFETEIHTEFRPVFETLAVTPIEEAPVCTSDTQFYGVDSRLAMGRLLRSYLERMVVTPTEILHNDQEARRLLDRDTLVPTALARVATLQAGRDGDAARVRRDDLFRVIDRLTERTRTAEAIPDLPRLAAGSFDAVYENLSHRLPADDLAFTCLVVLSHELVHMRSWLFKLDTLIGHLGPHPEAPRAGPVAILESACADVLVAPSVLTSLLGAHGSALTEIVQTLDLCQGRLDTDGLPADHRLARLNDTLASDLLGDCRQVLFDTTRRQIRGTQPLTAEGDAIAEAEAFAGLLARLTGSRGVLGGGGMAEALTIRFGRSLESAGASGRREAIAGVVARYTDAKDRLRYLLSLAGSELGREHAADIIAELQGVLGGSEDARHFITRGMPLAEGLASVTGLYELAVDSALAATDRQRLADTIDSLLALYIANTGVVARLDSPDEPLRPRADRLLRLCIPGVLNSPRALETARQLVIGHLRQPGFDQRYTAGITDPAQRQQALRDFYGLLTEAGFC
ncbi:MAG: hypothetical protein WCO00_08310 [Rhodospirillaceae bacterium]